MQEHHDNDKIEPHNHNEYPLLYKEAELLTSVLGRFLECRKCNILVITWALRIFLIYMPAALGLGNIYQANPSCPWYNYYIYIEESILLLVSHGQTAISVQGIYRLQYKRPMPKEVWEVSQCQLVLRPTGFVGC